MKYHVVVWIALLAATLIVTAANAAATTFDYSFTGTDFERNNAPVSFSFTEPNLLTTTGTFSFTPFAIEGTTFTYGFMAVNGTEDCFIFGSPSSFPNTSCGVVAVPTLFVGTFIGATSPGTYAVASFNTTCVSTGNTPCVLLKSLTITAVPEPSSLLLFGTGALGLLGPIRRKLLG
jgi:hypothetical protein